MKTHEESEVIAPQLFASAVDGAAPAALSQVPIA